MPACCRSPFGLRGGFAAAALAAFLTVFDSSAAHELPFLGYVNRFLIFAGIGAIVGWFIDREKETFRAREEAQAKVRPFVGQGLRFLTRKRAVAEAARRLGDRRMRAGAI